MNENGHLAFYNPATGEQFGEAPVSRPEDIVRAQRELRQNLPVWRRKSPQERARILKQLQKTLLDHAEEITRVINQDTGKSRQGALAELYMVIERLHTYCKLAPEWLAPQRVSPGIYVFKKYRLEYEPFGVVAILGPWNFPLELMIPPVYSALLAGNVVLLKPSEVTPAVGALVEKLFQSVPALAPFVRVVHGDASVGAAVVQSNPDMVFLTGSTETGYKVAQATAEKMIPFTAELGGKDAMIVLEDANIEEAARWGVWGAFFNAGQTCVSVERVYVIESVYDRFLELVLRETERMQMGYSPDERNDYNLGSLTCDRQVRIIEEHMADALEKGARVLAGGERSGLFMEPTVVVDVDHSMKLMRKETFGPIMPIMKVKNEEEAVRMANDSDYGLSASVWSEDWERAQRLGKELEVGSVVVNDVVAHYPVAQLPFGGMKKSGMARTHGKQDVLGFTQMKSYAVGHTPFFFDIPTKLRQPNQYRLMSAILHLLYGVTPGQRLQAVSDTAVYLKQRVTPPGAPETGAKAAPRKKWKPLRALAAGGITAGLTALALTALRGRREV